MDWQTTGHKGQGTDRSTLLLVPSLTCSVGFVFVDAISTANGLSTDGGGLEESRFFLGGLLRLFFLLGVLAGLKFGANFLKESRDIALQARGVEFAFKKIGESGSVDKFTNTPYKTL